MKEQIVTGKKFRILADVTSRLWHVISFWTKAQDVEFNDGTNAQSKLGNIVGISDSLTSTASNVAASAKAVKVLNDKVVNQIGNLNEQINNKNNTINDLNSQITDKNNQINNLNSQIIDINNELENLRSKSIIFDSYDNGFKSNISCSGSGRPASGRTTNIIDNSQLKFRYAQCQGVDGSWWDHGDGGISVNDHTLYAVEKGYKNGVGWYTTTTTDTHIYDMGTNPPDTLEISCWANGSSAGGSDTGTVRTTGTISFWR